MTITEPLVKRVFFDENIIFEFAEGLPFYDTIDVIGVDLMNPKPGYSVEMSHFEERNITTEQIKIRLLKAHFSHFFRHIMSDLSAMQSEREVVKMLSVTTERSRGRIEAILGIAG